MIVIELFLFGTCYGKKDDPGDTVYCDLIKGSSIIKDRKCKINKDFLYQLVNSPPFIRCVIPGRVIDLSTNMCYAEQSYSLFYEIEIGSDGYNYSLYRESKISVNESKNLAALDGAKYFPVSGVLKPKGGYKIIYEFDPVNGSLGKVIWNQDPNDPSNKQFVEQRGEKLKDMLVPMPSSTLKGLRWIIAVSSNIVPIPEGNLGGTYYHILQVSE